MCDVRPDFVVNSSHLLQENRFPFDCWSFRTFWREQTFVLHAKCALVVTMSVVLALVTMSVHFSVTNSQETSNERKNSENCDEQRRSIWWRRGEWLFAVMLLWWCLQKNSNHHFVKVETVLIPENNRQLSSGILNCSCTEWWEKTRQNNLVMKTISRQQPEWIYLSHVNNQNETWLENPHVVWFCLVFLAIN